MENKTISSSHPKAPKIYQIRIQGHFNPQWQGWFDGFTLSAHDSGDTLLTGAIVDQSALHGVLRKIRDLGIPLISLSVLSSNTNDDVS
jgi:hypothetical protein